MTTEHALAAIGVLAGSAVVRAAPLAGGSLSPVLALTLADGREAVAKRGPAPQVEAAMLEAIAGTGAPAPAVLGADRDWLLIEKLPDDGSLPKAWGSFGSAVARLHGATGERFGWSVDYAFGRVPIANDQSPDWPAFWAERRLLTDIDRVPARLARRIERLAADLGSRLPDRPRPALLHGDLWTGNLLAAAGAATGLIDPACYYGHCEVDLAMLTLFGSPSDDFFAAYGALEAGADARRPVYQLWPALVHLHLFGSGYEPMVDRLLAASGV